ncbi:substrate-binding domain-containing protein [Consotaella aegiceratis]|uniref:substrate-binding domain-containing protein n=1 Tax=Consotaella aegiceratis TaxID=3097961 RepID=UPI002F4116A7
MPAWADPPSARWVPRLLAAVLATAASVAAVPAWSAGLGADVELVDPDVLRVCADPANMPFSNEKGEGFENKLAELVADQLGRSHVSYTFFPQGMGFERNTLGDHRCDVVMGFAQGGELVQNTNAYYRSAYVLVVPSDSELADVASLADPRLKGRHIGVIARTPPATSLATHGLMADAKPYFLMVDSRVSSPVKDMMDDLAAGEIDAAVAWGPMAGYFAQQSGTAMTVTPLLDSDEGTRMTYRITMGVRRSDQEWKRTLNRVIRENQDAINDILLDYGVPLLDEHDQPITRSE